MRKSPFLLGKLYSYLDSDITRLKPNEEYAKMVMQSPDKDPLSLTAGLMMVVGIYWKRILRYFPIGARKEMVASIME